jgi:hypothetical protein
MHIEAINNGMGAPSMFMMVLAGRKTIPCDVVITADTGSENDCLLSTGQRVTADEFYQDVIEPLGNELKLKTRYVRAQDKNGNDLPPIIDKLRNGIIPGVPMYGSNGGQLAQGCTDKWKIRAVRQELRRMGATTATSALGLTMDEVHRMKQHNDVKWHNVYWPLIDKRLYKGSIRRQLKDMGIPYMLSSECDMCPHKNRARWAKTSQKTIDEIEEIENGLGGTQFFTPLRIPLKQAIASWGNQPSLFDGCDSGYCFT